MQPKFTYYRRRNLLWLSPLFFLIFSLFSTNLYAQPTTIYQTDLGGGNVVEITSAANGPNVNMGDAIVLAGTNRYINRVEVVLLCFTDLTPFNLTLRLFTDCSTDGSNNSSCGNGPGVLVPNSTITKTGIVPPALGTLFTVVFDYVSTVNLTGEADNQIDVVLNASRADVNWLIGETPVIGSIPPGEPATSFVTRCGSIGSNNGCSRNFGIINNFAIKILASATPCSPVAAGVPTLSSVPSSTCTSTPITLSVLAGNLNGASDWKWYTGSCGGTLVGTGTSITVSPAVTTTYFVRGEGGCAPGPGLCATQTVTVINCSCIKPSSATICEGSVQKLDVVVVNSTTTMASGTINLAIPNPPDALAPAGLAHTLAISGIPAGAIITGVSANFNITHTWDGDLSINLKAPNGNVLNMVDRQGGSGDNFTNTTISSNATTPIASGAPPFTGTFLPDGTIPQGPTAYQSNVASFAGLTSVPNGNWEIAIRDHAAGDPGVLNNWTITINWTVSPPATWTGPAGTIFTNAGATTAYVAATPAYTVWVKPTAVGLNNYVATLPSGPCVGANTIPVTLLTKPVVSVTPNPGGCSPAVLTASGTGASIFNWSAVAPATNANLSSLTGATVTATTGIDASYRVNGYGTNGCAFDQVTVPVKGSVISAVISSLGAPPTIIGNEGFNTVAPLPVGWASQNLSSPVGATGWFQGNDAVFPAQSGATTSYIGANFNNTTGTNTISNWLFTPTTNLQNGDQLTFWTRTATGAGFPDRLQVRMSTNGASVNAGATSTSTGDFSTLLLDINPTLIAGTGPGGYPDVWTQFTANVSGLAAPISGRLAFRYFVTNGGPGGANSNYIGIDNVSYLRPPAVTCPFNTSSIKVDITGGFSPYTLVYSDGTTNRTVTGYVSGTPIQVTPGVTTTYTVVSVTSTNGCAGSGNSGSAVITVTPPPSITTQPVNRTICTAQNTTFAVTAGPALGTSYQWQVSTNAGVSYSNVTNGGVYSGATTATLSITGATAAMNTYRYQVVINGACPLPGSMITSTAGILTVNQAATITTQPSNTTRCLGTTATFTVVAATITGTPSYQWQVSTNSGLTFTNISGATSATLTLTNVTQIMNNNQYQVIVSVSPCTATVTSTPRTLTVTPLPIVSISSPTLQLIPGRTSTITATSSPAAQTTPPGWAWTRNGVSIAGTSNTQVVDVSGVGSYRATATDINGCVASSNILVIGSETSERLWIYPNPTTGVFQVRLYYPVPVANRRRVTIYNMLGQEIITRDLTLLRSDIPYYQMNFDLSNMQRGTYLVKVTNEGSIKVYSGFVLVQ